MTDDTDLLVRGVIGRLFEEPEPTHRADLADGAIAHGMAVTRRRGFAVAGATLSVLAVVAGAVAVSGGGQGSGDWSLNPEKGQVSPQPYEDAGPTYADRQREIIEQLPAVLGPLLPAGVTVNPDQRMGGGVTWMKSGEYSPGIVLRAAGGLLVMHFDTADHSSDYATAFMKSSGPVAVAGGTIRMAVTGPDHAGSTGWYEFSPADTAKPKLFFYAYGDGPNVVPMDTAAFKKMVEAPGFSKLQRLLDPSVPASADAVRQRYSIEAKVNAEAAKVLPRGFRLKLNPGTPGALELVGPAGVNAFAWFSATGMHGQIPCPAGSLCYAADQDHTFEKARPDGKARMGVYEWWAGRSTDVSVGVKVYEKSHPTTDMIDPIDMGKPVETAPQGPGLTPQQAWAIVQAPGLVKVIADVEKLTALN